MIKGLEYVINISKLIRSEHITNYNLPTVIVGEVQFLGIFCKKFSVFVSIKCQNL